MKKIFSVLCAALLAGAAATATPVFAEEAKGLKADDVKKALGMSIYLQGGYTYNGNAVDSGAGEENSLRVFDHKANSFGLDLAQVVFSKDPATGVAGFKVKLSAGETAKWIHSRGLSGAAATTATGEDANPFDVTEAYMSYTAAVGKGVRFDFGKMATYHGAEVIEAKDNANYSRSFLFNYAIPFTHTGLKVGYGFTDTLSASLHIVNGWDNSADNNTGKTYGVSVAYAPADAFSGYINLMTGAEQDHSNNKRNLVDIVATIKPMKKLAIILNGDYATDEKAASGDDAKWSGISAIAKYDISDTQGVAVRAEYFNDEDGVRTGTVQKLKEVTLTWETKLDGGLIVRPEFRHDESDQYSFDSGAKKTQDTIALGVMYNW